MVIKKTPQLLPLNLQFFSENDPDYNEILKEIKNNQDQLLVKVKEQEKEIKEKGQTTDKTANAIAELENNFDQLQKDLNEAVAKMNRPGYKNGSGQKEMTIGEYFSESETVKRMIENGGRNSEPVQIKSFFNPFETKDLSSDNDSAGVLIVPQRKPGIVAPPERELRIRDLLNVAPTTSNAIEYVEETGFTNNAGAQESEGAAKKQSNITFDLKTTSVKTLAHWIPASRQVLADASQLQSYVNNRLIYGLKEVEEDQILYGDGLNGNLEGIMTNANIQDHGARGAEDNFIDHIRKAITKVQLVNYPATGLVLNPLAWEKIELMKGDDGHYIWLSIGEGNQQRLFRVPVSVTNAIDENDFLTGAFGLAAQLWDREQANVRFSEHHADYFTHNMVAILAEERLALEISRPEGFVKGSFEQQAEEQA